MIVHISDAINPFHRAHQAVIDHMGGTHAILHRHRHAHFRAVKDAWQELHGVEIHREQGTWKSMEFASQEDFLLFMLRWS